MAKKFYKGSSDIVFKSIFLKESNRDMLERLIEEALNKKVKVLEVKASELPKGSVYERGKILDVLVDSDEGEINIEVNSYSDIYLHRRNASYIFARYSSAISRAGSFKEMKNYIQINLTREDRDKELEMISVYELMEIDRHDRYIDNFTIYEFNISKIKDAWYNGDRSHNIMALLDANLSELDTMNDGDEIMDRFKDEVKNVNRGLGDVQFMDPDEDAEIIFNTIVASEKEQAEERGIEKGKAEGRVEGLAEGIKQNKIDTARKMQDKNIDINTISEITGLSIEEIDNL